MMWVVEDKHVIVCRAFTRHGVFQDRTFFANQAAWNEIFYCVFGQQPTGITDSLWDELFDAKDGYGMLKVASSYI